VGAPLQDGLRESTFAEAAAAVGEPPPAAAWQHFDLVRDVPAGLVGTLTEAAGDPALTAVELRHWGGAMARPEPDSGPVGHRDVPFSVLAVATPDRERDAEAVADRLLPYATGGTFLNFLTDPARTASAYTGEDYVALRALKRDWDPDNVLGLNHNIPPA
jgi:hypothetical protein